jgi:hypothetical protein
VCLDVVHFVALVLHFVFCLVGLVQCTFEHLDGEGLGTKGRITAMTVAEGLNRKKIEALLKVGSWVWCSVSHVLVVCLVCFVCLMEDR